MNNINRVILIILDGVGAGELPDAKEYGDENSNSLGNTATAVGGLSLPALEDMGLGNLTEIKGVNPKKDTYGAYGKMAEISKGKDSMVGHWEIAGIFTSRALPVYPDGFPRSLVNKFEKITGRKVIGNKAASGTEIIKELGVEHLRTGKLIIYTSADSVFQVAAHTDIVSIEELYRICELARGMLTGKHAVGRVIARPFTGQPGVFRRTDQRKDWTLPPPEKTLLDYFIEAGCEVVAIGKIDQIFSYRGITQSEHAGSNRDGINVLLRTMERNFKGLIFINLGEFDTLYGHRNDAAGYAKALEEIDSLVKMVIKRMHKEDILVVTADHGNDPTTPSTDHSREYVPLLIGGGYIKGGINLGIRETFADLGATISDIFHLHSLPLGKSFKEMIMR